MMPRIAKHIGFIAVFIAVFGASALAGEAKKIPSPFEFDCYECYSPIFDGVKRAYIKVNYSGLNDEQQHDNVPPSLRRQNIEQLLLTAYRHRFSTAECRKQIVGEGKAFTYGCSDQPVELAKDGDFNEANLAKPGTLAVAFDISIDGFSPDKSDYKPSSLVAAFHISHVRLDKHLHQTSFPKGFSSNLPDDVIRKKILKYVLDKIR